MCHSVEDRKPIIDAYGLSAHTLGMQNADGSFTKHIFGTNTTFADGSLASGLTMEYLIINYKLKNHEIN